MIKKVYEYRRWFLTTYQLYTKTNQLAILKKKCISHLTTCDPLEYDLFVYPQFANAGQEIFFYKRLSILKKTWKSWTVSPSYEWGREYGIILFTLYKTVLENEFSLRMRTTRALFKYFSIETFLLYIRSVNNQILSLPLEAILQTIELLAEALPTFFEEYQTSFAEISFSWIQKYWWTIIITGIPLWLKIMIIFKNYYQHEKLGEIDSFFGGKPLIRPNLIGNMQSQSFPILNMQVDNKPDSVPHIQGSNHLSLQLTRV